jgi:hypothetical protein
MWGAGKSNISQEHGIQADPVYGAHIALQDARGAFMTLLPAPGASLLLPAWRWRQSQPLRLKYRIGSTALHTISSSASG